MFLLWWFHQQIVLIGYLVGDTLFARYCNIVCLSLWLFQTNAGLFWDISIGFYFVYSLSSVQIFNNEASQVLYSHLFFCSRIFLFYTNLFLVIVNIPTVHHNSIQYPCAQTAISNIIWFFFVPVYFFLYILIFFLYTIEKKQNDIPFPIISFQSFFFIFFLVKRKNLTVTHWKNGTEKSPIKKELCVYMNT